MKEFNADWLSLIIRHYEFRIHQSETLNQFLNTNVVLGIVMKPQAVIVDAQCWIGTHSFIQQWLYSSSLGPGLFSSFIIIFIQSVRFLRRVIRPSQGRYLYMGQHKVRINSHTVIHALSEIRTHDPSFREKEDSSCLRPWGHCDRLHFSFTFTKVKIWNGCIK